MSQFKKIFFITGGNRGIGFELVRKFSSLSSTNLVITTTRNIAASDELIELSRQQDNVKFFELDISSQDSINKIPSNLKNIIGDSGIDVFISNAGIAKLETYSAVSTIPKDVWLDHYTTNVLGTILTTQVLLPLLRLRSTRQIVWTSSRLGSISEHLGLESSAYGQSKAAINYTLRGLSQELGKEGFTLISLHPGLVRTDMAVSGMEVVVENQPELKSTIDSIFIDVGESGDGIVKLVSGLTTEDNGKFYDYTGAIVPW